MNLINQIQKAESIEVEFEDDQQDETKQIISRSPIF